MEGELQARLDAIEKKLDATFAAADKTRKYILFVTIVTVIAIVVPLIGMFFAIPAFLSSYSSALGM